MLSALAADRARIARLEAQISDLERSLAILRLEKTAAQERLDSYKYPVLTLPNEIISEIFIQFLPIYPECPPAIGPHSPTLLTHICREWREIALATPALWRAVSLSENLIPYDHISAILRRSGGCPLSIHMDEPDEGDVSEGIAVLLPHRARWGYLRIRLFRSRLPAIGGEMPLLRHLDLELGPNLPEVLVFNEVPLLRTAILDVTAAYNVGLPWTQLTSLTLRLITLPNCVPILRQATNLVRCELDLWDGDEGDHLPDIALPYLESLCCDGFYYTDSTDCLAPFIVPALRSLQIPERFIQPDPINFLTAFITKSACKLQEVRIVGSRLVRKGSYRRAFPSIRTFFFGGEYVYVGEEGVGDSDSSDLESISNSQ